MSDDRRIVARLREADRGLGDARLSAQAIHRISASMAGELERQLRPRRFGWIPMLTFVAGAAVVLLTLLWRRSPEALPERRPEPARTLAADVVAVSGSDCQQQRGADGVMVRGACNVAVEVPAMRIASEAAAQISVARNVVDMREGSALFDVESVAGGDPVRVNVPGGTIVVIGTRFRVDVEDARGQVELFEGRLEFHADGGGITPIEAGERLAFARAEADAPTVPAATDDDEPTILGEPTPPRAAASRPAPPVPADPIAPRSSAAIIDEVQALRRRGDYDGAVTLLREALGQRWPARTAEVLSYELGTILARHLGDVDGACAHWQQHLARFADTRYQVQISASQAALGCEQP